VHKITHRLSALEMLSYVEEDENHLNKTCSSDEATFCVRAGVFV
jgi:hypothetical protein